tara:strand:+ start:15 stop:569 length:555 start_codon:yes stop_codon:yes gene_type:complete
MVIEIKGLDEIQAKFNKFNFMGGNLKYRFLEMVGVEALQLLKMNTPVDTGELREGWMLQQSENEVNVMNDQQDLLEFITLGTIRHIPNPFIQRINHQIDNMVMARLEAAMAQSHQWFAKLPGGKNRKFQQVGRTSAGFKGGTSFAGRSSLIRAGTGRRQLKRRLALRRRRGRSINNARKDVKVG